MFFRRGRLLLPLAAVMLGGAFSPGFFFFFAGVVAGPEEGFAAGEPVAEGGVLVAGAGAADQEAPVATAKAEPAKPKVAKPRPAAIGFQDGDAKKVHPGFFSVINDGTQFCAADVANFAGHTKSAGPRTGIASRDNGHHWVVRRFTEPVGPRQYLANFAKTEFPGLKVVARQIERDFIKQTLELAQGGTIHTYTFVHQDDFLVTFTLYEGRRGHDFSAESRRIAEATKKLIDERFPVE